MGSTFLQEPEFWTQSSTKLPVSDRENRLITSALPYVNNVPHLGNIIGCVLSGDCFARFSKITGHQVLYICGTDEYGTATEMKALKENTTPKAICDSYHKLHKEIYEWFNIDFDKFGRTSTEHQTEITQSMFKQIHDRGFISTSSLDQLHCSKCSMFLADRFVTGTCPLCNFDDARGDQCDGCGKLINAVELIDPKCHICGMTPSVKSSKHLFLDLKALSPDVEQFVQQVGASESSQWSPNAVSIVNSWIKVGLEPRCITRDLKWGTPVPLEGFDDKVFYVWFDAPIGYLSITKSLLGDDWIKWWKNPENVNLYQFVGKDNVAFHGVMFPSCEIASGDSYTLVKHLCATEYLNYEDKKFSKSRGIGVFGDAAAKTGIPADVWRFYLLYMRPESQDTAFSWDDFMAKVNSELLSNLGNFIHRGLTFLFNTYGGTVPEMNITEAEEDFLNGVNEELRGYRDAMDNVKIRDALTRILALSRRGNQYMQANTPWKLAKGSPDDVKRAATIIGMTANIAVLLGTMLYPFMPAISTQIRECCNINKVLMLPKNAIQFLKPGHKINQPVALFAKLEADKVAEFKRQFGSDSTPPQQVPVPGNKKSGEKKVVNNKTDKKMENKKDKKSNKKSETSTKEAAPCLAKSSMNPKEAELHQKLNEMTSYFNAQLLPTWEKSQIASVASENAQLSKEIDELQKELLMLRKSNGCLSIDDYKSVTNPVPEGAKLVCAKRFNAAAEQNATQTVNNVPKADAVANKAKENVKKEQPPKNTATKKEKKEKAPKEAKATTNGNVDDGIDVGRLDLRVGRIVECVRHPDADALYLEKIDLGEAQPRTVISGLVRHVPIEQMQNRLVVVLCNLKPAKMRGIESQGMVMCASSPEKVEIMEVEASCKPGDIVTCSPYTHRPDAILNPKKKIWEGVAPDLMVSEDGKATYKGAPLLVSGNVPMTAPTLRNVPVK